MTQTNPETALVQAQPRQDVSRLESVSIFENGTRFDHAQRVAKALAASSLVPESFRGNIPNTLIALDMADRLRANPLAVMQSIYIVHGKPSWAATFVVAMINSSGKFSPLRFELSGAGDDRTCVAWAKELATGERLDGPEVSVKMARAEGWFGKTGSKWQTMPELMLRYRSATFFGRLYCPELLLGMHTTEEVIDVVSEIVPTMQPTKPTFGPKLFAAPEPEKEIQSDPPEGLTDVPAEPEPAPVVEPPTAPQSVHEEFAALISGIGVDFDMFVRWGKEIGQIQDHEKYESLADVPIPVLKRLLKARHGLTQQLTNFKAIELKGGK